MKSTILSAALFCLALGGAAFAKSSAPPPAGDAGIQQQAIHEVLMYPYFGIFDDVNVRVENGMVQLTGEVSQPMKKSELGKAMAHIPGVSAVSNDLQVAPLSAFDDQLRRQVANAVYRDPFLSRYSMGTHPPIHILVNNGHVTLEGVVRTEAEKQVAGIRANSGMSFGPVINHLRVEDSQKKN